ncbi:LOW QUALITY PROTEIN: hypothetical protein Cgig2_024681 [Carnegiea gigantea]|uniref:Uncharacterized protein n=1 Tax=Carnegiea gigantea TaxID=171969 RepID=A0A9Q1JYW6_9CARY|nr:LOW QUALITY PROTEIN: hypothetical protein Cgig2_024681 [Carnegiea gigantea]
MDALKNFMTTITDTILQQVKKTTEAVNSARPLPTFVRTQGCDLSHRHASAMSLRPSDEMRETTRLGRDGRSQARNHDRSMRADALFKNKYKPQGLRKEVPRGDVLPTTLQLGSTHAAPLTRSEGASDAEEAIAHNHDSYTTQRTEVLPQEEECSTEIVATITGGYAVGITRSAWKAQLRGAQQVLMAKQGMRRPVFYFTHNNPLVVELKVASAFIRRSLIDTRSSVDIRRRSESHRNDPTYTMIPGQDQSREPGDFLVVDLPTAYNVILRRPTLHKFEADDGSVEKLQGDQWTAWEWYLVSIQPLVECLVEREPLEAPPSDKRQQITFPPPAETLCLGKSLLRHKTMLQVNKRKEKKDKEGQKWHFLL